MENASNVLRYQHSVPCYDKRLRARREEEQRSSGIHDARDIRHKRDLVCARAERDALVDADVVHRRIHSRKRPVADDEAQRFRLHWNCPTYVKLRSPTNFGRPNWDMIFRGIRKLHAPAEAGVFFCGPKGLGSTLHIYCNKYSEPG